MITLRLDEYEVFSNTAIVLENDVGMLILSTNLCHLPNGLVALNSVDYPWALNFLVSNGYVTYDNSSVLSESVRYPVVKPTFKDPIDITDLPATEKIKQYFQEV